MGRCDIWESGWRCCRTNESSHQTAGGGAVKQIRPSIGLLAQPKSMRSIIDCHIVNGQ